MSVTSRATQIRRVRPEKSESGLVALNGEQRRQEVAIGVEREEHENNGGLER